jgi:SAM-dependent methyltransferase
VTARASLRTAAGRAVGERAAAAAARLVERRLEEQPELRRWYDAFSDEAARTHEQPPIEAEHVRRVLRLFHAWRVHVVRERMGDRLPDARCLDVGDTDGLMLSHLGKAGTGLNLAPDAVERIRANGVEAVLGDAHGLPFEDASFDCVLCFETLEHVENPHQLLTELARVCRPGGRLFVSIPWVPHTLIHARDPSLPRGHAHVFELARDDFAAVVSHTPFTIAWESACDVFGAPGSPAERALMAAHARSHIVAGVFRRFQFFELRPERAA